MSDIPKRLKNSDLKVECWVRVTSCVDVNDSNVQVLEMLCDWTEIADVAYSRLGESLTIEVPAQGGDFREIKAPAFDVYRDACNQILKLRSALGLDSSEEQRQVGKGDEKENVLNVVKLKFDRMQKAPNCARA